MKLIFNKKTLSQFIILLIMLEGKAAENRISKNVKMVAMGATLGLAGATVAYKLHNQYGGAVKDYLVAAPLILGTGMLRYASKLESADPFTVGLVVAGGTCCVAAVMLARARMKLAAAERKLARSNRRVAEARHKLAQSNRELPAHDRRLAEARRCTAADWTQITKDNKCGICLLGGTELYLHCEGKIENFGTHCGGLQNMCQRCLVKYLRRTKGIWTCPLRNEDCQWDMGVLPSNKDCQVSI